MAITRKSLLAMGIEEAKIDQIIEMHTETVDALKAQRDDYKADAEKLSSVQQELDALKASGGSYETQYNTIKKQFDDYKDQVETEKNNAAKSKAYRDLLVSAGLKSNKLIDTILKGVDLSILEMDGEKLKDSERLTETIKDEWKDQITNSRFDWSGNLGGGDTNKTMESGSNNVMNALIRGAMN